MNNKRCSVDQRINGQLKLCPALGVCMCVGTYVYMWGCVYSMCGGLCMFVGCMYVCGVYVIMYVGVYVGVWGVCKCVCVGV
jgi:hypothetical protein